MKFAVFVILACLSVCYIKAANPKVQTWGNITGKTIGTKNVIVSSSLWQTKKHVFTYPEYPSVNIIHGITHMDFKSHPIQVRFLKGGINERNVTLQLESQKSHGMNSTFIFYG